MKQKIYKKFLVKTKFRVIILTVHMNRIMRVMMACNQMNKIKNKI